MTTTGGETATEVWEKVHAAKEWGRWPNTRFVEWAMRRYRGKPATFLELGSGIGANLRFLRDEGFRSIGIEISASAATHSIATPTLIGDVRNLRELLLEYDLTAPFDCIFDVCTLQHLTTGDALDVIRQAQDLLPKGGTIWSMMAAPGYAIDWASDVPAPRLTSEAEAAALFGQGVVIGKEIVAGGLYQRTHLLIEWTKP